jgi:hypothetical protein
MRARDLGVRSRRESAYAMSATPSTYERDGLDAMRQSIARLRTALAKPLVSSRAAEALSETFDLWRARNFPGRRTAIAQIADASRWSIQLLDESIDALLAPFSRDALMSLGSTLAPRPRLGGFIMPANVPGAGMHELVASILSGSAAIMKTSLREPVFFPAFAQTLRKIDAEIGARVEVVTFARERRELTHLMMRECDFVVALGDDATVARLTDAARLFGFGSRTSGALVSLAAPANVARLATALARDVVLFEQQGCLSPHHIFAADADFATTREFAIALSDALNTTAAILPPATLSFQTAAAIRRIRERARWRGIGGHSVELFEGADMAWTAVLDAEARFTLSPGYRTVTVSSVRDCDDLAARLAPVAGRIEAFALAVSGAARARFLDVLAGAGVTYVCDPGKTQSPPINWPHGGGDFLDYLAGRDG